MKITTNINIRISKEILISVTHCIYKKLKDADKEYVENCIDNFCETIILDVKKKTFKDSCLDSTILPKNQLKKLESTINQHDYVDKHLLNIVWSPEDRSFTCNWDKESENILPEHFSFSAPLSYMRICTSIPTKCIIEYSNKTKISCFMKELKDISSTATLHERYYDFEHKRFTRSPFIENLEEFMKRINHSYNDYFVSHWFNTKEQALHFKIREKTWMEHQYNRNEFIKWLKSFFPDFQEDVRDIRSSSNQKIFFLGKSNKLNIAAIETEEEIPKSIMRSIAKEHAINNFFEINKNATSYYDGGKWWKLEFWWSDFSISKNGKVSKKQSAWIPHSTKTWHYFGEKKIRPNTYDISKDREYKELILGKAKSVDDIIRRMDINRESIPPFNPQKNKE